MILTTRVYTYLGVLVNHYQYSNAIITALLGID
jgi:hypothetical protein